MRLVASLENAVHVLILEAYSMINMFRAALIAAIATASISTIAAGQNVSTDRLIRQIDSLQRRTDDLERRVSQLEARVKDQPSRSQVAPASANPRDIANWRRLRRGMTMDDVRALLGEPESVNAGYITTWHYPKLAEVSFTAEKVYGWSEPRREE